VEVLRSGETFHDVARSGITGPSLVSYTSGS
jgi:hypothetical protein